MGNKLEICCVSLSDCIHAYQNGADRIELCASMAAGGLTPSFGLFQLVKKYCAIPIMVMIRPRGAGFCYDEHEFEVMVNDATYFLQQGAEGIVFGCLTSQKHVDVEKVNILCNLAHRYGKEAIFHRAIDECSDILKETKLLCAIGVDRLLTAGGKGNALQHIDVLRTLQNTYGDSIQIQMCGNIREGNVIELMKNTKISQVHTACREFVQDRSDAIYAELSYENAYDRVNAEQVENMARIIHAVV